MVKSSLLLLPFLTSALGGISCRSETKVGRKATPSPIPTTDELTLRTQEQFLKAENYDDGSLTLEYVGTLESVPALLKVIEDDPPRPDGVTRCTTELAIDALKKVMGADAGYTYRRWKSWWYKDQNATQT